MLGRCVSTVAQNRQTEYWLQRVKEIVKYECQETPPFSQNTSREDETVSGTYLFCFLCHTRCGGGHGGGEQRGAVRSVELPGSGSRWVELQRGRHGHHPAETWRVGLVVGLALRPGGLCSKQLLWGKIIISVLTKGWTIKASTSR